MFEGLSDKLSAHPERADAARRADRGATSTRRCARCGAPCSRPTSRSTWCAPSPTRSATAPSGRRSSSRSRPGQQVVKIVHDQLVEMLGAEAETIDLNATPPVAILMVGLQGSGKTTTTAKIARRLADRRQAPRADGLPRHPPPGRDGTARRARQAGRRRDPADRRRPVGRADRPPGARSGPARRLRRRDARHRRPRSPSTRR